MAQIATAITIAAAALRRNRLRSVLCVLSLTVGVAAVITIVALGRGAQSTVEAQIMSAGTNMIIVSAGNWTSGGVRLGMGSSSGLTVDDADAIRREIAEVRYVSPGVRTRQQLINGRRNWSANVEGVGADLPRIRRWPLSAGTFFSARDVDRAAKVVVIGTAIRDALFEPRAPAVGSVIRIGFQLFRVVGVLAPKGQSAGGADQDDAVFVPFTTAQRKLMGVTYLRNIVVAAGHADDVPRIAAAIRGVLRIRHAIAPGRPDDFRVRSLEEIAAVRTRAVRTMTALLSAVAAVSLLVGGIGVMNIMLVSVTERTREIGLRLAVGARQHEVRTQFLIESLLLSASGGLLGVAVGYVLANVVTAWLSWPTAVAPLTTLVVFATTATVGIGFGWYPARLASRIDPIVALHYE
jgi:putative ABC transport system permease protein